MANTFSVCYYHLVFSTKNREMTIKEKWRDQVWKYLGGVSNNSGILPICIGGTMNHVHLLLSIPPRLAVSNAVLLLKSNSSKWIHEEISDAKFFQWQEGYGVFTIGQSQVDETIKYIENQETHHRKVTFEEEYKLFLEVHDIQVDERYIFG